VTAWAQEALRDGGYALLALLICLENLIPPIPSELLLPLAGYQVFAGTLDYVPAVLAATAGSVAGALILYTAARLGGRPLLLRYGRMLRLSPTGLDRADAWFDRHGSKLVLGGRLIPTVRSVVSVPAGLSEMPVGWFVALTALGSAAWNAVLIGAGWALGESWSDVAVAVEHAKTWVIAGVAAVIVGWLLHRRRSRRVARR
jgi:membrane protein DedA with SNARE-associated domain